MNTSQIIRRVRELVDATESVGSGPWSDDELLRYANLATGWMISDEMKRSPLAYARVSTLASLGVTTEQVYTGIAKFILPDFVARVIRMEFSDFSAVPFIGSLEDFGVATRGPRDAAPFQALIGQENVVWLRGINNVANVDLRIWYAHRPAPLARFQATGGSTTTIVADTSVEGETTARVADADPLGRMEWVANRYIDALFEVTAAAEALPVGEVRRATASARSAYPSITLTFGTAFSAAVEDGDTIDMIPQLDPLYHELICYDAAIRALERVSDVGSLEVLMKTRGELARGWQYQSTTRQDASSPRVRRSD